MRGRLVIACGRQFRVAQLAKAMSIVGSAASPLLFRALRGGTKAAFEFSARAVETCNEMTEIDPIPAVTLGDLFPGKSPAGEVWLDLKAPSPEMPPGELASLCALARLVQPRRVVEIGTASGWTTRHLARNTPGDCRIITVDLPAAQAGTDDTASYSDPHLIAAARSRRPDFSGEPKITQVLQDSTSIDYENVLDQPVGLALIDGSHLYQHVRADTERLWKTLAFGAVVLWHDYATVEVRRGVRKFLLELRCAGLPIHRLAGTRFGVCVYSPGVSLPKGDGAWR